MMRRLFPNLGKTWGEIEERHRESERRKGYGVERY